MSFIPAMKCLEWRGKLFNSTKMCKEEKKGIIEEKEILFRKGVNDVKIKSRVEL